MPLYTANAIVLRRTNFGEADRIVTLYTREYGKISAIAKSARKPISRLAGATEVFTYARFQLASGRNLDIISQVEVKDSFPRIHADLFRIANAGYICELVDKMLEEAEASGEIFDLMLSCLYLMDRENDPGKITHMFELQFMRQLGYEPVLDRCIRCTKPLSPDDLFFSPSMGGIVCPECGRPPEDAIRISEEALVAMRRLMVAGAREVENMEISQPAMDQIARAMRWYIRYRSDRELKSAEFLETLRSTK